MSCRMWVCTSPGRWKLAQNAWACVAPGRWKEAKKVWHRGTTWAPVCPDALMGAGFLMGGSFDSGASNSTHTEWVHLFHETITTLAAVLAHSLIGTGAFASTKRVYFSHYHYLEGIIFATKTTFVAHNLPDWQYDSAGLSDILKSGFTLGGRAKSSPYVVCDRIFAINLTTHTSTSANKYLSQPRDNAGNLGNLVKGFVFGGVTTNRVAVNRVDRFVYTTRAVSVNRHSLRVKIAGTTALGDKLKAYIVGGAQSEVTVYKMPFNTEVNSLVAARLSEGRTKARGLGAGTRGLICGGRSGLHSVTTTIERLDYVTQTSKRINITIALAVHSLGGGTNRGTAL